MIRTPVLTCTALICAMFVGPLDARQGPDDGSAKGPDLAGLALEDLMKIEVATVVTASKFVQDIGQAPASVTVVTAEEIRLQGFRTLADVLRSVRGFYVSYDRNYSYVGVRGFSRPGDYNTRILVLVNGHRLNDGVFDLALLGTEFPIDIALLDRVEIIRGPSSSLYGTSAFFAVVNLLTRSASEIGPGELAVEAGSLGVARVRGTVSGRAASGLEGVLSATGYRSHGQETIHYAEFDSPTQAGIARGLDGDASASTFGSVHFGSVSIDGAYGSREKAIPTGAFDTVIDRPGTRTVDAQGYLAGAFTHAVPGQWTVDARGGVDHYAYRGYYLTDAGAGADPYYFVDSGTASDMTGELTLARRFTHHVLTAGVDARWNFQQDQAAHGDEGAELDDHRRSTTVGLYAQDEWRLSSRVLFNAGLRLDHYSSFGATVNPRFGAILTPRPGSVLKLLAGRAFRAPSAYELFYFADAHNHLEPESVWTGEVAWEQRASRHVDLAASVYRYEVNGLITQADGADTPDGLYFRNAGGVTASGIEGEIRVHWGSGAQARLSHAFGHAEDTSLDQVITNSPQNLTRAAVILPLGWRGVALAANGEFIGDRGSVKGATVPGAALANLTISRHALGRHADLACSVYNVFDVRYSDPASGEHRQVSIAQDGRTFAARIAWTF